MAESIPTYAAILPESQPPECPQDPLTLTAAAHDRMPRPHSYRTQSTQSVAVEPPAPISHKTPSGLSALLELESDTIEIYDRSNDSFQYSLKGAVELNWTGHAEVVLKEARIDFMGYADTAVLRYEAGLSTATETPVHHTHDFIPTPLLLAPAPASASSASAASLTLPRQQKSLPIDITLPGHLPESVSIEIGKIRYELQVSLEFSVAPGTSAATCEPVILRKPVLIHRIVYPSAHLQPRLAMGLDSGGVEIQVKVPRLLHCENTLLAVELFAKPRTKNVKLKKAKIVFEQIETDRYIRTSSLVAVPTAVPLTSVPPAGPPPAPRLVTRKISQPLEIEFEQPLSDLQVQNPHLQLVLSPALCVDVQSSWLQISHTLRVEVEYTTEEDTPYMSAPLLLQEQPPAHDAFEDDDGRPGYNVDDKKPVYDEGQASEFTALESGELSPTSRHVPRPSIMSNFSSSSSSYSVASEEVPVRVVRVVATALVDATTIAQAAGETEAGLPTYESVIEATGLPAYAEEKLEDDHEDAEASGTATGVLGGAARRLEGDDAQ